MKTKKLLSLLLAVMMVLSVVPMYASAAEPITLTEANVVEWPTANGEMYYTQKVGDHITLSGGIVTEDGTATGKIVAGHFDFIDPEYMPSDNDNERASIKFIPDDSNSYSGFEINRSSNVTFSVKKATMEFVDSSAIPTATDVVAGKRLNTSDITGVAVKCQLTGEVLTSAKWSWTKSSTKVNESGYYSAKVVCNGYETINVYIYVRIAGDTSAPTISEFPTIKSVTYKEGLTASDLTIVGGSTTIPGTFAVADPTQELKGGSNVVGVVFTPDDTSVSAVNISMVINVDKMESSFIDDEGNAIVPEVRVGIGYELTFSSLKNLVEKLAANCGKFTIQSFSNISYDTSATGEFDAKARISPADNNYSNEINFKLIIEPKQITPTFTMYGNDELEIRVGGDNTVSPKGTFDFYVNDELAVEGIEYGKRFTWRPANSGTYDLKAVYNPVENDTYKVNDVIREDYEKILTWKINCINCSAYDYRYGETATVMHRLGDQFGGWVFYDAEGNEFTPENVVEESSSVSFTMPDFSLTVEAKEKGATDDEEEPGTDVPGTDEPGIEIPDIELPDLDLDTDGSHKFSFVNIIKNIVEMIKDFIQQIGDFFGSLSLDSLGGIIG